MTTSSNRLSEKPWLPWLVFGLLALVYLLNRSPYVGFGDGLSFLYDAETGFNPYTNATSHFFYNNLQHLLLWMFIFMPSVLVMTLFSVTCGLLGLFVLYRLLKMLGTKTDLALLVVVLLGMSFTYWQQSEVIDVYAFNNLLFLVFLFFALKDILNGQRKRYWLVALLMGLCLLTHIQHILALPFFGIYLWGKNELRLSRRLIGSGIVLGMGAILILLPLLSKAHSVSAVFFDSNFKAEVLGMDAMGLLKGAGLAITLLLYNFHLGLVLMLHGTYLLWKRNRQLFWWLFALWLPFFGFAVKYSVSDGHVFFLVPYLLMALPAAYSLEELRRYLKTRLNWLYPATFLLPPLIYAAATLFAPNIPTLKKYDEEKAYKGGVQHLLWPGKAWAKDPFVLARFLYENEPLAGKYAEPEWNYEVARLFLEREKMQESVPFIYFQF